MSILYAKSVPKTGGDTLWANMALAYDNLAPAMRAMLDPLEAVHDIGCFRNDYLGPDRNVEAMNEGVRSNGAWVHPVIGTHPVTGAKYINVNRSFTQHIVGMLRAESDRLLEYVYQHIDQPEHQVRFRWRDNSVAMWDNRVTQHYALADYLPGYRCMNRVTVNSDRPRRLSTHFCLIFVRIKSGFAEVSLKRRCGMASRYPEKPSSSAPAQIPKC
jgi:taurine dioxygenase